MKKTALLSILYCVLAVTPLTAQSIPFINISPDARTLGMGGAALATSADAFVLYNNPSAMALSSNKLAASASYTLWQPNTADNTLASAAGFGKIGDKLAIGAGVRFYNHSTYNLTGTNGINNGTYTPKEYSGGIGVAYQIIDGLSVGVGAHFIGSDLAADKQATTFAADLAVTYQIKGFTASLAGTSFGGKVNYGSDDYSLPSMGKLGLAYNVKAAENHNVTISVEGDYLLENQAIMGGLGLEYSFKEFVAIRAGYHYGDATKYIPSYASVGIGVSFVGICLDAAYLVAGADSPLKNSLSVSLGYRF